MSECQEEEPFNTKRPGCWGGDTPQVSGECKSRSLTLGREAAGGLQASAVKVDR